ncbi:MAG: hypothetical protein ABSB60_06050 [Terracidiphilus sp.]|jgi:hypothetical protein
MSLEKALRVPNAIAGNYGYKPATPLQVAAAIGVQPSTGPFRMLTGSSIAYDLTAGGAFAESISLTPLGLRIVRPTVEGDDIVAKREAVLKPRVIREFLQKYAGAPLPKPEIARNVLIGLGVPSERADETQSLILENANAVGFIRDINGRKYVELTGVPITPAATLGDIGEAPENGNAQANGTGATPRGLPETLPVQSMAAGTDDRYILLRDFFQKLDKSALGLIRSDSTLHICGALECSITLSSMLCRRNISSHPPS